ncbi:glycerophosphoryl diester phosphodiesterase membrane domain-containing protein [Schaalia sp. ZJ405]|uniref:glycerophosphoryl diester phosphodiesterase membrane domain-containing protein n=1 Tax=Schaalia sp. ZJ405 TaxID=2709403 RepID=UPI0013ED2042|nr:glycerophosphoryl diester phosphodiesterase membrane domain-containing protein [Schaalia sp. ZJ405]QPK81732.1 glycerophosphoryl diester phosphodiesterase membrane domain-containing protein [Schaalia sp. ZJ405]
MSTPSNMQPPFPPTPESSGTESDLTQPVDSASSPKTSWAPPAQGWSTPPVSQGWSAPPSPQWQSPAAPAAQGGDPAAPQPGSGYPGAPQPGTPQPDFGYPGTGQPHVNQPAGGSHGFTTPSAGPNPFGHSGWSAAQPGVIPLRPLKINDLFEGTFRTIRSNPTVMFGFAFAIMAIIAVISTLFSLGSLSTFERVFEDPQAALSGSDELTLAASEIASTLVSSLTSVGGSFIASVLLVGIIAIGVSEAVIGRKISIQQAWNRFRPRVFPVIGITLLTSLIFTAIVVVAVLVSVGILVAFLAGFAENDGSFFGILLAVIAILGVMFFLVVIPTFALQVKLLYAPIVAVLEERGPIESLKRSWTLTRGSFWKTLGRLLLITIVMSVLTGIISSVVGIGAGIFTFIGSIAVVNAVSTGLGLLASGLVTPVLTTFEVLMYIDERVTRENLASALIAAAQEN